ncbi:MAG TPA: GH1 family beta-glucosidase [Nocardioides sp.]|uniref:GH1 family beta-glucosidase n=1 Tax=Nocardioides sp. TaxID=35761 RepID=UPI002D8027A8|nr:GH1 family beta-glucosidase [Nocardioides sp.]HET6651843.1 GH1 family beta-glucosidase [Nocardioides sp.]
MTIPDLHALPASFLFGASTASYQIEGAVAADGRGASVWDTFCAVPGRIRDGSSGAEACDHYHRYAEDVSLMKGLGLDGYRFSVAWPRVQPAGSGPVNPAGIAFYDRLVDELLAAGIEPMATLFHWDLPQPLEDAGGWLQRTTAERFGEYAAVVAEALGDRVTHWAPVNEPNVVTMLGYATGVHAPGRSLMLDALPVAHHLLLGHGLAVQALRTAGARSVGAANNHTPVWSATDSDADREAAALYDTLWNRLFADPLLRGEYPAGFSDLMPGPVADDLRLMSAPLDFYGVNYYNPTRVAAVGTDLTPIAQTPSGDLPFVPVEIDGYERTGFDWPVVPDGLRDLLVSLHDDYGARLPPVMVTENGCAYDDPPDPAGAVHDDRRIDYLRQHLQAVAEAAAAGVDVRGYYTWSLLDNFEWAEGYTQRFGLVHVDYATQRRTPKDSYPWYARVIADHRSRR